MAYSEERIDRIAGTSRPIFPQDQDLIQVIARKGRLLTLSDARALIKLVKLLFDQSGIQAGFQPALLRALTTKFRDAGRRSAPWKPASSKVPGRPQDGSDGNRINRWLMPEDHKFYANEIDATLVEIKYYLQAFSMLNAPKSQYDIKNIFTPWLVKHEIVPGAYRDPVQRIQINFIEFINEPRLIQSGHLDPLDRDGRHVPENTYLMLYRSNQIQGNMKMEELIDLMTKIVEDYKNNPFT
jgi:hypothetical protein